MALHCFVCCLCVLLSTDNGRNLPQISITQPVTVLSQLIFNEMLQPQALCLIRISSSLPFSCMTAISANYTTVSFQRLRLVFLPWKQAFSHPPRLASYSAQAVRSQIVIHLVRPWSLCSSLASHRWQRSCFSCKYLIAFTWATIKMF